MALLLKIGNPRSLFWMIFLFISGSAPLFFLLGFFKPPQANISWLFLFGVIYILLLFFLFFYLKSVFYRDHLRKMAEISAMAEEIQAEKLASLGTMSAGIAHEINNPLGIILGYCGLLLEKIETESQFYKDLKTIERQGLNCKQVVDNLLNFTRVSGHPGDKVNLNEIIEKILTVVGPGLNAQGIFWECSFSPTLPLAPGNTQKWQQVFLNLINNAKTAMPEGGSLKIWTSNQKHLKKIEIGIQDSGTGIPAKTLHRIFDPFFTTKIEGRGIGLGLSITYGIISNYGGTIGCRSETKDAPGRPKGSIFLISVPTA
jgi:two-component system, NtrC family, sensor kinase